MGKDFIHKLGARAILGDLEKGQSWIHLDTNRANNSLTEEERVLSEGESIGCKWSLVSKWTSFYAVDEPHEPNGQIQDPFIDRAHLEIPLAEGGMDLLLHRGMPQRLRNGPAQDVPEEVIEIDLDSGHDSDASSDSEGSELGPRDNGDSSSDNDQDDRGGPPGGNARNNHSADDGQ